MGFTKKVKRDLIKSAEVEIERLQKMRETCAVDSREYQVYSEELTIQIDALKVLNETKVIRTEKATKILGVVLPVVGNLLLGVAILLIESLGNVIFRSKSWSIHGHNK